MAINSICICGAGTMGSGIAQVSATAGYKTILYEVNIEVLEKAKAYIEKGLSILVTKNKITVAEKVVFFNALLFTNQINDCKADLVIEAIVEKSEIKIALFNQLAQINNAKTIFATNTSSLSVTEIANQIPHSERFIGMHFFNPAPVMKLVEVVNTHFTDKKITEAIIVVAKKMSKTPVVCKDAPGFIVNRVARPFYIESLRIAEEQLASFETIDHLLEATGFKMGPFRLMDLIGNDVNYAVSCSVFDQLQKPERLKPSYLQKEKVAKGELGKKTGKGYYKY
jgi:3-hydroxybutyryl-CoA dehydrogenase